FWRTREQQGRHRRHRSSGRALGVRKWNSNLSPMENMRANFKQTIVKQNLYSAMAGASAWTLASFVASMSLDRQMALTYFFAAPTAAFLTVALGTYAALPHAPFGRRVVDFEVKA